MQKSYQAIKAENAELVVITTDAQAVVKDTANNNGLEFVTLSDRNTQVIGAYNATDPFNPRIARPQYYIIDETGVIKWKFLDNRKQNRLPAPKVVEGVEETVKRIAFMTKAEEPINQVTSDPIVTQILADCAQVSGELTSSSEHIEPITRRRFLKGAIGAGVAVSTWSQDQLRIGGAAKPIIGGWRNRRATCTRC